MIGFLVSGVLLLASVALGDDLAVTYPATLDHVSKDSDRVGHAWETGPEHIWKVRSFEYEIKDKLKIKVASCNVVIGHTDGNAMWAYLIPDRSAKISSSIGGDGEKIQDIWLRFHPSEIGDVLPAKSLRGQGDPDALYWAYRNYPYKIGGLWGRGDLPTVPSKGTLVIDIDTEDGKRRVYDIDMKAGRVKAKSAYLTRAAPKLKSMKRSDSVGMLEDAWKAMDEKYSAFERSPDLDWAAALEEARKGAVKAKTDFDAGIVVRKMFDQLSDDDLWVFAGGMLVTQDQFEREFNANWGGLNHILGNTTRTKSRSLVWAKTPHNVGYINLLSYGGEEHDEERVEEFDEVLDKLAETWALVIDLRYTRNGNRQTGEEFVGRFLKERQTYGYSQTRNGEGHDSFAEAEELACEPRGPWTYEAPIYLLLGPGTAREGEQLALMLSRAEKVITMGSATGGQSANMGFFEIEGGLRILISTGRNLDVDGNPLALEGIQPDVPIEFDESEFTSENDPVIYRVLEEVLKTTGDMRLPANRNAEPGTSGTEAAGEDEDEE